MERKTEKDNESPTETGSKCIMNITISLVIMFILHMSTKLSSQLQITHICACYMYCIYGKTTWDAIIKTWVRCLRECDVTVFKWCSAFDYSPA